MGGAREADLPSVQNQAHRKGRPLLRRQQLLQVQFDLVSVRLSGQPKAERDAAQHSLEDSRDKTISQVWQYYTDTKLAIRRLDVAAALVDASEKSYQQTFEAYQNGLSSLVDVLSARSELSQARYTQLNTRATVLESTAALAFASGDLGQQLLKRKSGNMSNKP